MKIQFIIFTFFALIMNSSLLSMEKLKKDRFNDWLDNIAMSYESLRPYVINNDELASIKERYFDLIAAKDTGKVTQEDKHNTGLRKLAVAAFDQRDKEIKIAHSSSNFWIISTFVSLFSFTAASITCLAKDFSFARPIMVKALAAIGAVAGISFAGYKAQRYSDQENELKKEFVYIKKVKNKLHTMDDDQIEK